MADVRGTRFSTPSPPDQASAFLGFLTSKFPIVNHRRPVVTVEKPERLLRRLFQAAVEIINRKCRRPPLPISTGCGSFHRSSAFPFFFSFRFAIESRKNFAPRIVYKRRSRSRSIPSMADFSIPSPPAAATAFGCASSEARISRCGRDVADGPASRLRRPYRLKAFPSLQLACSTLKGCWRVHSAA